MGDTSEREFLEKIVDIKTKSSKKGSEIKNDFAKMQKLKAESLKKTEEMMQSAENSLEKLEQGIVKSKDLVPESRQRLNLEIAAAKHELKERYVDLKRRISVTIVPE